MARTPRIAVILDENTSGDGSRYEAAKSYFTAIRDAGGLPFGIPYLPEIVAPVAEEFDGLLCVGGRFAYPDDWYLQGRLSRAPASERLAIEREITNEFLRREKPVLGICAGMQLLAGLHGCRLWSDVKASGPSIIEHDKKGSLHRVTLTPGTKLAALARVPEMLVNTLHWEAVGELSSSVIASARSDDGVIEAIEIPAHPFALGVQWHQEQFAADDHPGNHLFRGFVKACVTGSGN
ncbi:MULTISPECIES: gamma-glutamyl-gamma-aminobutyrate hydrolase family protein [Bradyrhizobium]|uniref:gamma-glutamyl-gamma-aminobutyrate hydrolase family protein n=1 Tax=Bradyrhizobium TaxID=374 RepID=UPI00293F4D46|nr:gamma-glutamyl-gamma-aminobutyrate hydrolase family protein [Bradyrhizobium sp. NDS-1]WOH72450.1 gamma-glutamyl-gamma-aminobutyrate hydrolase family protein [Bradyrhizobium sp. NDS-1]